MRVVVAPPGRHEVRTVMGWRDAIEQAVPDGAIVLSCEATALDPEPKSVSSARRFVAAHAVGLNPETVDTLILLTSELVTNVVVHARTSMEVVVAFTQADVIVGVFDLDLGRSEQRTHDRDGGRGLLIVESLADASGQVQHPEGGKTSWFRVAARAAA